MDAVKACFAIRWQKNLIFLFGALVASWLLTWTSRSILANFILIVAGGCALRCWLDSNPPATSTKFPRRSHRTAAREGESLHDQSTPTENQPYFKTNTNNTKLPSYLPHQYTNYSAHSLPLPNKWKDYVRSKIVEHAWETLCGSIVQEFIYDSWYTMLTPDKEFPAEIRRILNHVFGQGAARARTIDLRVIMEDASELLMEQIELYRDTREAILAEHGSAAVALFSSNDYKMRDEALRERMITDGNLHPALLHPDGNYKMLRAVSEGVVALLLDPADHQRTAVKAVARELLSGCVFRPLMMWCTPYHVNKGLYRLLSASQIAKAPTKMKERGPAVPEMDALRARAMQGHWAFEQRIVKTVEAEKNAVIMGDSSNNYNMISGSMTSRPSSSTSSLSSLTRASSAREAALQSLSPQERHFPVGLKSTSATGLPPLAGTRSSSSAVHNRRHARSRSHDGMSGISSAVTEPVELIASRQPPHCAAFSSEDVVKNKNGIRHDLHPQANAKTMTITVSIPAEDDDKRSLPSQSISQVIHQHHHHDGVTTTGQRDSSITSMTSSVSDVTSPVRMHQNSCMDGAGAPEGTSPAATQSLTQGINDTLSSIATTRPSPFDDVDINSEASFSRPKNMSHHPEDLQLTGHFIAPSSPSNTTEAVQAPVHQRPSPSAALAGFLGLPRARVVAADLNSSGTKDFVVYKIRVGDDSGREWTVSRRYRHFEVLHRQLRSSPQYKSKLPPKRIFIHTQNEDFVEDRRNALDAYLQEVLVVPSLARSGDVFEFLKVDSERFEVPGNSIAATMNTSTGNATLKRGISRTVLAGASSVGRGVVGAAVDVTRGVTHGVHEVTNAAVDGVGAVINEAKSGFAGLRHRRSTSVPDGLQEFDANNTGKSDATPLHHRHDTLTRAGTGLMRTATASARKVKNVVMKPINSTANFIDHLIDDGYSMNGDPHPSKALHFSLDQEHLSSSSRNSSPSKQPRAMHSQRKNVAGGSASARPPRHASPAKQRRSQTMMGLHNKESLTERSMAFVPGNAPPQLHTMAWLASGGGMDMPGPGIDEATTPIEVDEFGAPSPMPTRGRTITQNYSSNHTSEINIDDETNHHHGSSQIGIEACTGISAPLYEIVDCVFQLQTRGFFRRQVYAMARQALSIAMGDAIDVYLLAKLRYLRQETTIGMVIQLIQTSLWPGGVWFQKTPQYMASHPELQVPSATMPMSPMAMARDGPGPSMQPEEYLEPGGPDPLDEEEVREAVWELLLRNAPSALVRLVGKTPYAEGAQDMYEMIQSPTFMRQLGYGLLEITVLHLCPELKGLFQSLEHAAMEN